MKKYLFLFVVTITSIVSNAQTSNEYTLKGDSLFAKEKYMLAIESYDKAIELDSINAEIYFKRAKCYKNRNVSKKAMRDYTKAININPEYREAYLQRAKLNYDLGNMNAYENDLAIAEKIKTSNLYSLNETNSIGLDSAELLINKAGQNLINFTNQTYVANGLTFLGLTLITAGTVSNRSITSSNNTVLIKPITAFGIVVTGIGSLIHLIAPSQIGQAGKKLKKVKLKK